MVELVSNQVTPTTKYIQMCSLRKAHKLVYESAHLLSVVTDSCAALTHTESKEMILALRTEGPWERRGLFCFEIW